MSRVLPDGHCPRLARLRVAAVAAVCVLPVAACTAPEPAPVTFADWQAATAGLLQRVDVAAGDGATTELSIGADMPIGADVDWPYSTAAALTALGREGIAALPPSDHAVAADRLRAATASPEAMQSAFNAGPVSYTAYEMAWADRMGDLFTEAQRAALMASAYGDDPLALLDPENSDAIDVYVIVSSVDMLGRGVDDLVAPLTAYLQGWSPVCSGEDVADRMQVLAMAALPTQVAAPCSDDDVRRAWDTTAGGLAARFEPGVTPTDVDNASFVLELLEEVRQVRLAADPGRQAEVAGLFRALSAAVAAMDAPTSHPLLGPLQKTAHLLGESFALTQEQQAMVAGLAVSGAEPASERFVGASLVYPLQDAASLDLPLTVTPDDLAGADPVARLAVLYGTGQGLSADARSLITQILLGGADAAERVGVLNTVAPLLLAADEPCWPTGVAAVQAALDAGAVDGLQASAVALGVRVVEGCGAPVDPRWRQYLEESLGDLAAQNDDVPTLDGLWETARLQCAAYADDAEVGAEQWDALGAFIVPGGGALGSNGYVSLMATHEVLQLVITSRDDCASTGLMKG